jgi:nondiscriminating glutamyl-tRNA synthetase
METRVRFAPSPTGSLHVGGARTALYNFIYAKKNNGKFILRIEDTDTARSTEESLTSMLEDLAWLGLEANEGHTATGPVGEYGPYKQSLRLDIYRKYADQLLEEGKAYYCFLTDDEIDKQKQEAAANGTVHQVSSPYRNMSLDKAKVKLSSNPNATVRFKTPLDTKDYIIKDLIRGEVKLPSSMVGDFVILRSGGMPVYNFCCAIDDALMKITHVLRGEEHLSNSLRQMMIFEALNLPTPQFAHLSIILNEERKKLSKRDGDVSCASFRDAGYLPEALLNYISLLGWTDPDGQEIFTLNELENKFEISSLNAAGPVFDTAKLNWVNSQHIKNLAPEELLTLINPILEKNGITLPYDNSWKFNAISLIQSELVTLNDAIKPFNCLINNNVELEQEASEALAWETSKDVINKWEQILNSENKDFFTQDETKSILKTIQTECNVKGKLLFMPLRSIIIGKAHGYDLKVLIPLIKICDLKERLTNLSK